MARNLLILGHLLVLTMRNLLLFDENLLHEKFLQTDLGELYQAIPFEALAASIHCHAHSA